MISIHHLQASLPLFQALSSEVRAHIFNMICLEPGLTSRRISQKADIPASTLAHHIRQLETCGLICPVAGSTGSTIRYYPAPELDQILIYLNSPLNAPAIYKASIPVGHYSDFNVTSTCGMATPTSFIGLVDEPRYFAHPCRHQAEILWFSTGYLEYLLPNFIPRHSRITRLELSFEIASEAPTFNNDWPSDITFSLNGVTLGTWTSPGDYGDRRGQINPDWWYSFLNQYGLLKKLVIREDGTFLDDQKLSDVTVGSLGLTDQSILRFRFSVLPGPNARGCTLYGASFGDHSQALALEIAYAADTG